MFRNLLTLSLALGLAACSNGFDDKGDDPDGDADADTDGDTDTDTDTVEGDDVDDDGDGFTENDGDCDDDDADVNPDATEVCNDRDDDCNGEVDDDPVDGSIFYEDVDGDGFGNGAEADEFCDRPAGYVTNADDCDDSERTANPDGVEVNWNGVDEDCDGLDVDTTDCIQTAINETAATMTGGLWAVAPFNGTYYETITGFGLPVADWSISNQYLSMTETLTAAVPTDDGYAVDFRVEVAMNDSAYTGGYFYSGSDFYYEGPFWLDVELDSLYSYLGLDYDTICDAWVDPTPQAFTGTVIPSVDAARREVTADAQLAVTLTPLTADDVNYQNPTDGAGVCQWNVIDTVVQQLGYGDPSAILDESFATTLTSLESLYESELEANVALYCSGE